MSGPCVLSVAEHTGWAYFICVAAQRGVPVVIDRWRITLIDPGLPTQPYEHDTLAMREDDANALIARVRRSVATRTSRALQRLVTELAPRYSVVALTIRKPPFDTLPATVAEAWASHRLRWSADGMLYQLAICRAARELDLEVHLYRRKEEAARAAEQLGVAPADVEAFVAGTGRPAGPPWGEEHRRAFAAGIAVLAGHVRGRLSIPASRDQPAAGSRRAARR